MIGGVTEAARLAAPGVPADSTARKRVLRGGAGGRSLSLPALCLLSGPARRLGDRGQRAGLQPARPGVVPLTSAGFVLGPRPLVCKMGAPLMLAAWGGREAPVNQD